MPSAAPHRHREAGRPSASHPSERPLVLPRHPHPSLDHARHHGVRPLCRPDPELGRHSRRAVLARAPGHPHPHALRLLSQDGSPRAHPGRRSHDAPGDAHGPLRPDDRRPPELFLFSRAHSHSRRLHPGLPSSAPPSLRDPDRRLVRGLRHPAQFLLRLFRPGLFRRRGGHGVGGLHPHPQALHARGRGGGGGAVPHSAGPDEFFGRGPQVFRGAVAPDPGERFPFRRAGFGAPALSGKFFFPRHPPAAVGPG